VYLRYCEDEECDELCIFVAVSEDEEHVEVCIFVTARMNVTNCVSSLM
jgi:hypothetical protein